MNFIDTFKYNYHLKIIHTLVKDGDLENVKNKIKSLKKNDFAIYKKILKDNANYLVNSIDLSDIINNNIVWLNSYNKDDLSVLKDFLNFYFSDSLDDISFIEYEDLLVGENSHQNITVEDIAENQYQRIINTTFNKKKINFVLNNSAFYHTSNNLFFTKTSLSKTFIYLVKNPIETYLFLKEKKFNGDQDLALNYFLNLDQRPHQLNYKDTNIDINIRSWLTNLLSWSDENVKETFRGIIIKYEDLMKNSSEQFRDIIAHLVQCDLLDKINYSQIDKYIESHNFEYNNKLKSELSGKEKKFLSRELDKNDSSYYEW